MCFWLPQNRILMIESLIIPSMTDSSDIIIIILRRHHIKYPTIPSYL